MKNCVPVVVSLLSLSVLSGCGGKKKDEATALPVPSAGGSVATASSGAAPAASAEEPTQKPTCTTSNQKVWSKGVNSITGLTAEELADGTDVLGLAVGNTPHVLTVKEGGAGSLQKVTVNPGSAFAKAPKAGEGTRIVWRVTPVKIEGTTVRAFVDFRDEMKASDATAGVKGRKVVCGPADLTEKWVVWEGPAIFDDPKYSADPVKALVDTHGLAANHPYHEVRDCRTFYDPKKGEEWVVASGIKATMTGADTKVQSELLIATSKSESVVHTTDLSAKTPFKRVDYEAPISDQLPDGTFFLAARAGTGAFVASFVTHDKKAKGTAKSYPGYFQAPDLAHDGTESVLIAAQASAKGGLTLRGMRIAGEKLPEGFSNVTNENDEAHSASRPEFLRDAKGQRWIAYLENVEKGKGTLEIMPVGATFRSTGRPYAVTKDDERAMESRLFAKAGGGFIVAYIRDGGASGGELVTEDLDCKVEK